MDSLTILYFASLLIAIVLHELAHGLVADRLGDDTARLAGRLTLNPRSHLDPFGTVLLPLLGAISGVPVLGFARPIPVRPSRLRSPRRDLVLVALAGPFTNLALAAVGAVVAKVAIASEPDAVLLSDLSLVGQMGLALAIVNLFLGLLNLIPIPPLDGARLIEFFLPTRWLARWHRFGNVGFLLVFALVLFGASDWLFEPVLDALLRFIR